MTPEEKTYVGHREEMDERRKGRATGYGVPQPLPPPRDRIPTEEELKEIPKEIVDWLLPSKQIQKENSDAGRKESS